MRGVFRILTPAAIPLLLLAVLLPAVALGHTDVTGTTPADGATVERTPSAVVVEWSAPPARLDAASVTVAGTDVSGSARIDPEDARRLVIPIQGSAPGSYEAEWQVTAADGHRMVGSMSFTVSGASPMEQVAELGALLVTVGAELGEMNAGRA